MIDTRDLAEKREELQTNLVDSFNDYFDTEIEDFDELVKYIDDSENEDVQEWRDDIQTILTILKRLMNLKRKFQSFLLEKH